MSDLNNKAYKLLLSSKTAKTKAERFVPRIKESLDLELLRPLKEEIAKYKDKVFDLEDFTLDTNLNKGNKAMTKEECEERFKEIIILKHKIVVKELELKAKESAFNDLFL